MEESKTMKYEDFDAWVFGYYVVLLVWVFLVMSLSFFPNWGVFMLIPILVMLFIQWGAGK